MRRRTVLLSLANTLAAPHVARAQSSQAGAARTTRFVAKADPAILDPVVTTGLATRNQALLIFDTLYGVDEQGW